jgi:uncharacterized protein (DUF1800 family)
MTVFWHNHFVVQFLGINEARYGYEYIRLLRSTRWATSGS